MSEKQLEAVRCGAVPIVRTYKGLPDYNLITRVSSGHCLYWMPISLTQRLRHGSEMYSRNVTYLTSTCCAAVSLRASQ